MSCEIQHVETKFINPTIHRPGHKWSSHTAGDQIFTIRTRRRIRTVIPRAKRSPQFSSPKMLMSWSTPKPPDKYDIRFCHDECQKASGKTYQLPKFLKPLQNLRKCARASCVRVSKVSKPRVGGKGGVRYHAVISSILSAATPPLGETLQKFTGQSSSPVLNGRVA